MGLPQFIWEDVMEYETEYNRDKPAPGLRPVKTHLPLEIFFHIIDAGYVLSTGDVKTWRFVSRSLSRLSALVLFRDITLFHGRKTVIEQLNAMTNRNVPCVLERLNFGMEILQCNDGSYQTNDLYDIPENILIENFASFIEKSPRLRNLTINCFTNTGDSHLSYFTYVIKKSFEKRRSLLRNIHVLNGYDFQYVSGGFQELYTHARSIEITDPLMSNYSNRLSENCTFKPHLRYLTIKHTKITPGGYFVGPFHLQDYRSFFSGTLTSLKLENIDFSINGHFNKVLLECFNIVSLELKKITIDDKDSWMHCFATMKDRMGNLEEVEFDRLGYRISVGDAENEHRRIIPIEAEHVWERNSSIRQSNVLRPVLSNRQHDYDAFRRFRDHLIMKVWAKKRRLPRLYLDDYMREENLRPLKEYPPANSGLSSGFISLCLLPERRSWADQFVMNTAPAALTWSALCIYDS